MTALDTLQATIEHLLADLPAGDLPGLMGILDVGKARVLARIMGEATAPKADTTPQLVDAVEMARIIDVPVFWVQDKGRRGIIPRVTIGHYQRFNVPEVLEAVRHLPKSHDFQLRLTKKRPEKRGSARPVSIECPKPSAETAA
jgi:hypothetical protein